MKIEIIIKDKAYVYTPYNAEFVAAIKGIGGARWYRDKPVPRNYVRSLRRNRFAVRRR